MTINPTTPRTITLLGATGSIGHSTLDVIAQHPQRYRVHGLSAYRRLDALLSLCQQFQPAQVAVPAESVDRFAQQLAQAGLAHIEVLGGESGLRELATAPEADTLVAAIVGAAGLMPTLAAVQAGKRVLLANKEALVMSGALFMQAVADHHAELLPVDSEHNAIFQSLPEAYTSLAASGVDKILLTASGGPFRGRSAESLQEVTPEQAIAHPNWSMGQKISVDSATLMNKGLELIEACWLFHATPADIDVIVHPQSVIHSMVRYADGSVLAQLGVPDMRTPIAHALAWPERIRSGVQPLDFMTLGQLTFEAPDHTAFPCLQLAEQAFAAGGTAPAVLNAANEVAVDAFLKRQIRFDQIAQVIDHTLQQRAPKSANQLDEILSEDRLARQQAQAYIATQAIAATTSAKTTTETATETTTHTSTGRN